MMPGQCAWTFVGFRRNPKVSICFGKTSFRIGSSPGSVISWTRGISSPSVSRTGSSSLGEPFFDRWKRVEQDFADDREACGRDLVERVGCGVPRWEFEIDHERGRNAELE